MKLSLAIMAVPQRRAYAATLANRIFQQVEEAKAAGCDVDGPEISIDGDGRGPWVGWVQAWQTHRQFGSTHHAVLQDDVRVCADLPQTLMRMIKARPTDFISGFLPRDTCSQALRSGLHWTATPKFLWAQMTLMPVALGDKAVEWVASHEPGPSKKTIAWGRSGDMRLQAYLCAAKRLAFIPVPHPVDHIGHELPGGSTLGHHGTAEKRGARPGCFLGEDAPLAGIRWEDVRYV